MRCKRGYRRLKKKNGQVDGGGSLLSKLKGNIILVITQEHLKEILEYNQETGIFRWRVNCGSKKCGDVAGCRRGDGYIVIRLNGILYYAHRLAILYVTGEYPEFEVDHKDMVTGDNRIAELRIATHAQNQMNIPPRSNNVSGVTGVYFSKKVQKWRSQITIDGRTRYLGIFKNKADAVAARVAAEKVHFGEFTRTR